MWSTESGNLVHNLKRSMQPCYSISANPEGLCIHYIRYVLFLPYILCIALTGTLLAVGSLKGYVSLWNLKDGSLVCIAHVFCCAAYVLIVECIQVREFKEPGDTFNVSWSSDGKMLCSCFSKGIVHVMRTDDIVVA